MRKTLGKTQRSKSCEKQIRGWGQSLSRWWEKQIMCEASSLGNHDTGGSELPPHGWVWDPLKSWLFSVAPLLCMCLSEGFIVCNNKKKKKKERKCVNVARHFPIGFLASARRLWPLKSHWSKNEYCRELQPGLYFPDAHLLSMADGLLQGNELSFWGLQSLLLMWWMQMFCPFLSLQPSVPSFANCL